jgi:hypothetical protein
MSKTGYYCCIDSLARKSFHENHLKIDTVGYFFFTQNGVYFSG